MNKIHNEKIKMRPKSYFIAGSVLTFIGLVSSVVFSVFLIGLMRFSVRSRGPMADYRLDKILGNFPWWTLVLAVAGLAVGIWLLRRYDFSFKVNFKFIVIGFIFAIIIFASYSVFSALSNELSLLKNQNTISARLISELRGDVDDLSEAHEHQTKLFRTSLDEVAKLRSDVGAVDAKLERFTKRIDKLMQSLGELSTSLDGTKDRVVTVEEAFKIVRLEFDTTRFEFRNSSTAMLAAAERSRIHSAAVLERNDRMEKSISTLQKTIEDIGKELFLFYFWFV